MSPQLYNPEGVKLLATHFPLRNGKDYAWGNAITGLLLIPHLRGLWAGVCDEDDCLIDLSGNGRRLEAVGITGHPLVSHQYLTPYSEFIRANSQSYNRYSDQGIEITGELSVWMWVRFHAPVSGVADDLFAKDGNAGDRSWKLYKHTDNSINFVISGDGTAVVTATETATVAYATDKWFFVAGRYTPSTEIAVWVGKADEGTLEPYTNIVGVPAALHNNPTIPIDIGHSWGGTTNLHDGYTAIMGLAACALNDGYIFNIFHQLRPLFMW